MKIGKYDFDSDIIELTKKTGSPGLKIYNPKSKLVVIGRGSDPEAELNLNNCEEDGIEILKREGGGCSVVLDPGNVIISVTLKVDGIGNNNRYFKLISDWIIKALNRMGIENVEFKGISDLVAGDRKIAGSCIYRMKGVLYYSVSILVDPDITLLDRYLKHPPREPDYREGRKHGQFVKSIKSIYSQHNSKNFTEEIFQYLTLDDLESKLSN